MDLTLLTCISNKMQCAHICLNAYNTNTSHHIPNFKKADPSLSCITRIEMSIPETSTTKLSHQYQCQLYTLCHHHSSQLHPNSVHPYSSHGYYNWRMRNYVFPLSSYHIQLSYQLQPPVPGYYAHSTLPRHGSHLPTHCTS